MRIHATISFSRIVTKNIRSDSERCAIERIATRGLPSSVHSNFEMSSGSPSIQEAKPGDASRLFKLMLSFPDRYGTKHAQGLAQSFLKEHASVPAKQEE